MRVREGVQWSGAIVLWGVALLLGILIGSLTSCGVPADPPVASDPPIITVSVPFPVTINLPADTATEAVRSTSSVVVTVPPFDCAAYVNSLPYTINDPEPARLAYRATAACRGWDQSTIDKWEHFIVDDVMQGESRWCPLIRRGATLTGIGCDLAVDSNGVPLQGRFEDSGVMQLVGDWYRPGGPLCEAEGMCSSDAIIASPWASFNAGLFAVEFDGRRPWAYDADSMEYHPTWWTVTRYWP